MTEKEIISKSDDIIEALVAISLGKGNILAKVPGSMTRFLTKAENHDIFESLKQCYIDYLSEVDSLINDMDEVKRLSDFRYELVNIYSNNSTDAMTEEEISTEEE